MKIQNIQIKATLLNIPACNLGVEDIEFFEKDLNLIPICVSGKLNKDDNSITFNCREFEYEKHEVSDEQVLNSILVELDSILDDIINNNKMTVTFNVYDEDVESLYIKDISSIRIYFDDNTIIDKDLSETEFYEW